MKSLVAERVRARAGHACERCGITFSQFWSIHHRRPRGMGGSRKEDTNMPANLILLCGSGTQGCHGWVESNRETARSLGLILHQGLVPDAVPVTLRYGTVMLDNEGGWQSC